MEKIMFFSDSPSDLLPEDTVGEPYKIVSSSVIYDDGRVIKETDVDRDEFYAYLQTCKNIPGSAMGTPDQWIEALKEAIENGYTHAIIYTISSTASSVHQSITLAREAVEAEHPGALTVEWIDSRQYSMIYGRLILESLKQIRQGWSFQKVADDLRERTQRNQGILGTYSLRCMQKSGRISGMAAFAGGVLGIRPILLARDGVIAPVEKVRGEKNLVPALIKHIKERIVNPEEQDVYITHGIVPEEELTIMEIMLLEEVKVRSVRRHNIGVTVVLNCGPETIIVGFYGEPL
ncbi:MAG: DegV family EDD domain-containing protein [Oscillospiraceae bacterium]|nr:DegV family EDD domain-containing protein [Oscillospiraceae bacterium]